MAALSALRASVRGLRGMRDAVKGLSDAEAAKLNKGTAERFLALRRALPSASEMSSVALAGGSKKGWYRNSTQALQEVFGEDAPRFTALLAATSPQTSVESNLLNALNIWKNWTAEGRPTGRDDILRIMGDSVEGDKGVDSVLDAWVNNSVTALTEPDASNIVLSGPKVDSFMRNLSGVMNEVTNDTWMARYGGQPQTIFGGSKSATDAGKGPGYLAMNSKVRDAADRLQQITGESWDPAEVQETVWSWAYGLRNRDKGQRIMQNLEELTDADVAAAPEFGALMQQPRYRGPLTEAGYQQELERLGERPALIMPDDVNDQAQGALMSDPDDIRRAARRIARGFGERAAVPLAAGVGGAALVQPEEAEAGVTGLVKSIRGGEFPIGVQGVETPQQAANVFAGLRKSPQEELQALVADADDRPLELIRHTRGTSNASSLELPALMGAIADVPGAQSVWFGHNHPSGVLEPSSADFAATGALSSGLRPAGIEPRGMLIVGPGGREATYMGAGPGTGSYDTVQTVPGRGAGTIPWSQRQFRRLPQGLPTITSNNELINSLGEYGPDPGDLDNPQAGILLLNNRNAPAGALNIDDPMAMRGTQYRDMLRAAHRGNAIAGAPIARTADEAQNMARAMNQAGISPVDAFIMPDDMDYDSLAGRGVDMQAFARGPFRSIAPMAAAGALGAGALGSAEDAEAGPLAIPRAIQRRLDERGLRMELEEDDELYAGAQDVSMSVLNQEGGVIGGIQGTAYPDRRDLSIAISNLQPEYQGQGIGALMYDAMLEEARRRGSDLTSDSMVSPDAQRMYSRFRDQGYDVQQAPEAEYLGERGTLGMASGPVYRVNPEMGSQVDPFSSFQAAQELATAAAAGPVEKNQVLDISEEVYMGAITPEEGARRLNQIGTRFGLQADAYDNIGGPARQAGRADPRSMAALGAGGGAMSLADEATGAMLAAGSVANAALTGIGAEAQVLAGALSPFLSEEETMAYAERARAQPPRVSMDPRAQPYLEGALAGVEAIGGAFDSFGEDVARGFGRQSPLYENVAPYRAVYDAVDEGLEQFWNNLSPSTRLGIEAAGNLAL